MIDVHTHLFNLKYFPVSGIIQSYAKGYVNIPDVVSDAVEFLMLKWTKHNLEIYPDEEQRFDDSLFNQPFNILTGSRGLGTSWSQIRMWNDEQLIENTAGLFSVSDLQTDVVKEALYLIEEDFEFPDSGLNELYLSINNNDLIKNRADAEKLFEAAYGRFCFLLRWVFRKLKSGYSWLRWFRFLMNSEKYMYYDLIDEYGDNIDRFVYHTLDLDHSFRGYSTFDYEKQIEYVHYLTQRSRNEIIPFVSFDPQREGNPAEGKKGSLEIVKDAIETKGFKGAKFYPPLGYRPYYINPSSEKEKDFNRKNLEFFRYCVKNKIPVFTHCTPTGFEADRKNNSGKNANPLYWEHLLKIDDQDATIKESEKMHNLILCLGHAGGSKGWFAAPNEQSEKYQWKGSYAEKVYELCRKFPNVYCEVGFLAEVHDKKRIGYFKERLRSFLKNESTTNKFPFPFFEKVMYGSDWHLLYNHSIELGYFDAYEAIFSKFSSKKYYDHFFTKNANRYLNF